ncbi:MAG: imelysin family protein, partial [Pseudomonadota bacterium]
HFYDALGTRNVYLGSYTRIDGTVVSGPSLSSLVAAADADVDAELTAKLNATMFEMSEMKTAAEAGFSYDMMLERGNAEGEALIMGAVNALVDQTRSIERAVAVLGVDQIAFEGSDSLDDPEAVFQ